MYVDRYRFAGEPHVIAEAKAGKLRALLRNPRIKAGTARRLWRDRKTIQRVYNSFANTSSQALFVDLLKYRLFGPHFTKVANNEAMYSAVENMMAADVPSEPAPPALTKSLGESTRSWSVDYQGVPLRILTSKHALYFILLGDQYYYRSQGTTVKPEDGDVMLDGGAFLGEMSLRFAVDVGPNGRVYSFDPFMRHVNWATENAARNGMGDRLQFFAAGLAAQSTVQGLDTLVPQVGSESTEIVNPGRMMADTDARIAIDDFCDWGGLERVNYIKMDIEGSEVSALEGAHRTIMKWKPKLAICVYHRFEELWTIPDLIRKNYPFYDLYLGHHTLHAEETVLYAVAKDRSGSAC